MDEIDKGILNALKDNGRATASQIGKQVNLSVPAVAERIRKIEQSGLIEKYSVKINPQKTEYLLLAFILVNIDATQNVQSFREKIVQAPCVLECHHIAGPNDYLLKVRVRNTGELEVFLTDCLKKIEGVVASNTLICLSTLKEEVNL